MPMKLSDIGVACVVHPPVTEDTLAVVMILPLHFGIITRAACLVPKNTPIKLTLITCSKDIWLINYPCIVNHDVQLSMPSNCHVDGVLYICFKGYVAVNERYELNTQVLANRFSQVIFYISNNYFCSMLYERPHNTFSNALSSSRNNSYLIFKSKTYYASC
ncbi:hypothetical protein Ccrd_000193 [Cynara cardunculus var. scolymus]|uniref:Uncharacterized protein n=1 Tax=Cynara cardunculus var. scolymus TaxID=59895 RepID=A0A103XVK7_CYNCS|nr:hypothetical protein Ccrd_000193 [Cynara cardunculus var. scolymus]